MTYYHTETKYDLRRAVKGLSFLLLLSVILVSPATGSDEKGSKGPAWTFTERAAEVGLDYEHWYDQEVWTEVHHDLAGGLAIGDINGDGWDDIFAVTGEPVSFPNPNPNRLFIANQDGTYTESAASWGLSSTDVMSAGPLIVDINDDGFNDLIVGGVKGNNEDDPGRVRVYMHNGVSAFTDATVTSGLFVLIDGSWNFGFGAGDIDRDGDLDLMATHWNDFDEPRLFENNGSGVFSDISSNLTGDTAEMMFTPTFADINGDGWSDLLLSSDFLESAALGGGSRYYLNDGTGFMLQQAQAPLTDENGMGGAVADYDNDGDLDWFNSSIFDSDGETGGNWGASGNRLYANDGNGNWTDVTDVAGVRVGYWGWGACWGDFNNDMHLDLYHVNGYPSAQYGDDEFDTDPAVFFLNDGDATFTEMGAALGLDDTAMGKAILCFDNDRDGDLDIMVNNNTGPSRFFENNLDNGNRWIQVKLVQPSPNHEAVGAIIRVTAGGVTQMRQIFSGGNYASSHPTAQHFGLAGNTMISSIEVTWPDGSSSTRTNVESNQYLVIDKFELSVKNGFE